MLRPAAGPDDIVLEGVSKAWNIMGRPRRALACIIRGLAVEMGQYGVRAGLRPIWRPDG